MTPLGGSLRAYAPTPNRRVPCRAAPVQLHLAAGVRAVNKGQMACTQPMNKLVLLPTVAVPEQ
jgi:hypothetical protein